MQSLSSCNSVSGDLGHQVMKCTNPVSSSSQNHHSGLEFGIEKKLPRLYLELGIDPRGHVCMHAPSYLTLSRDYNPTRLLCPWVFPGKNTGGLPFPIPGDLPDPGIELASPELAGGLFTTAPSPGKANTIHWTVMVYRKERLQIQTLKGNWCIGHKTSFLEEIKMGHILLHFGYLWCIEDVWGGHLKVSGEWHTGGSEGAFMG